MSVLKVITKLFRSTTVPITAPATALSGPSSPPPEPAPRLLPSGNAYRPFQSVESYDLKTGATIAEFTILHRPTRSAVVNLWYEEERRRRQTEPSAADAERPTVPPAARVAAIPKQGYSHTKFARIEAFDPETGRATHTFNGVQAAVRQGFSETGVRSALNGKRKTYKGYD